MDESLTDDVSVAAVVFAASAAAAANTDADATAVGAMKTEPPRPNESHRVLLRCGSPAMVEVLAGSAAAQRQYDLVEMNRRKTSFFDYFPKR